MAKQDVVDLEKRVGRKLQARSGRQTNAGKFVVDVAVTKALAIKLNKIERKRDASSIR